MRKLLHTPIYLKVALIGVVLCLALPVQAQQAASDPKKPGFTERIRLANGLELFPTPDIKGAYVLQGTSRRGEWQYAIPYARKAVQYAAYDTFHQYSTSPMPIMVSDISDLNGETPSGRHPGNAHHGGLNFDITYYMKQDDGSFIVCSKNNDNHCTGPADRLDAERQAYFFASLAELAYAIGDRAGTSEEDRKLIHRIAVDYQVHKAVLPELDKLADPKDPCFNPEIIALAKKILYSEEKDQGTGWFRYHHDHMHIRFVPETNSAKVLAYEKTFDEGISSMLPSGQTAQKGGKLTLLERMQQTFKAALGV